MTGRAYAPVGAPPTVPRPGTPRIGSFRHRGLCVAYATQGSGPPLVLDVARVHHLEVFWRHLTYRRFVEALSRRFTVIRMDRPGCGLSDRARVDPGVSMR